ncbi:hypothetical protein FH972_022691 [Carpinus fangiana]|uniref:Uncharacterized protein n=1 Tax=Carpinus fangiana TaxID=176857 RepID=A0A5N6KSZ6_9ROSI|nr:hypothetical protein FH972_022691 [Carpinus fangiana]
MASKIRNWPMAAAVRPLPRAPKPLWARRPCTPRLPDHPHDPRALAPPESRTPGLHEIFRPIKWSDAATVVRGAPGSVCLERSSEIYSSPSGARTSSLGTDRFLSSQQVSP